MPAVSTVLVVGAGAAGCATAIRLPDAAATLVVDVPGARSGGPDLPTTLGVPRAEGVTRTELTCGGRCHLAGCCPAGQHPLHACADRRRERARTAVGASAQVGRWVLERTPREQTDVPGLVRRVTEPVAVPA